MVKSPAALVPCCKTILPLWEAVEFPLSMVQMTPACKPLTEMFLDSVSAAGEGGGDGSKGWSFLAVISIAFVCCIARTSQESSQFQCWFSCILNSAASLRLCFEVGECLSKRHVAVVTACLGPMHLKPGESHCLHISQLHPWKDLSSLASFHTGHLVFICKPHTCCSSHLDYWAFVSFLVNYCYLLGLLDLPS